MCTSSLPLFPSVIYLLRLPPFQTTQMSDFAAMGKYNWQENTRCGLRLQSSDWSKINLVHFFFILSSVTYSIAHIGMFVFYSHGHIVYILYLFILLYHTCFIIFLCVVLVVLFLYMAWFFPWTLQHFLWAFWWCNSTQFTVESPNTNSEMEGNVGHRTYCMLKEIQWVFRQSAN